MSAATTVNVASAAIPENKTKKVSPSLIAVYVCSSCWQSSGCFR